MKNISDDLFNEMRKEALERLKMLEVPQSVTTQFSEKNIPCLSEGIGIIRPLNEKELDMVKEIREEKNLLVYHVVKDISWLGTMLSFFYVGEYKSDWDEDRNLLKEGYPIVLVKNITDDCEEFGTIGITHGIEGPVRTA